MDHQDSGKYVECVVKLITALLSYHFSKCYIITFLPDVGTFSLTSPVSSVSSDGTRKHFEDNIFSRSPAETHILRTGHEYRFSLHFFSRGFFFFVIGQFCTFFSLFVLVDIKYSPKVLRLFQVSIISFGGFCC